MKRSSLVDIIKGIMIIFIIITHFSWSYPADYLRYGFVFYIDMAIPVFMIISGYLYAAKYKREGFNLQKIYSLRYIVPQGLRFMVPFCGIYIVELLYSKLRHADVTTLELAKSFFNGGIGPGSYYTPIMLQFIIVVPLIALIVEKYRWGGTAYA